jgi:hypothetical protein
MKFRQLTAISLAILGFPLTINNAFATIYPHPQEDRVMPVLHAKVLTYKITLNDSLSTDVNWARFKDDVRYVDNTAFSNLRNAYKREHDSTLSEIQTNRALTPDVLVEALGKQGVVEKTYESPMQIIQNRAQMPFEQTDVITPLTLTSCNGTDLEGSYHESRQMVKITPTFGRQDTVIVSYDIEYSGKSRSVTCEEKSAPRNAYSDYESSYSRPEVVAVQVVHDEVLPVDHHAATTVITQGGSVVISGFHVKTFNAGTQRVQDPRPNEVTIVVMQLDQAPAEGS